ncbi:PREDICTED: G patch domain and KOW motifs-containing protein [Nanorana parkeri]|uniref:G patch domain and KOW motifs-containing protein n=1 Tax=Nanorana parkeri TaxID=125878 RepID=UPI000854F816|nr:PREDICTED: G patch domain and KOW motifs-containing protein [Nanorana parkeri]
MHNIGSSYNIHLEFHEEGHRLPPRMIPQRRNVSKIRATSPSNVSSAHRERGRPGPAQAPISFGFTRSSKPKLRPLGVPEPREEEKKEYLLGAEGKELLSVTPAPVSKPLVIPLIQKNRWSLQSKTKDQSENGGPQAAAAVVVEEEEDAVLTQAVQELIAESRKSEQNDSEAGQTISIPLLMQNRVPTGFEDGDKVNVDLRPESAEVADYETVPVEQYGMAMLRGMGWKEGEGIGKTFKQDIKPLEQKLRPKGLGLGADRSALHELEPKKPRKPLKPGDEAEEESKGLGTGSAVLIQNGTHKDLYGKVEGIDADNCRAMVKLAIGGKVVTVSQFAVKLVSSAEYTKYAKDLSRLSKVEKKKQQEEEREEREAKEKKHKDRSPDREKSRRDREETREESRNESSSSRDKRHQPRSPDRDKEKKRQKREEPSWLHRDLKVRLIDRHYKGGKYYNSKILVEDVLSPTTCVCRTEGGRILEDIRQDMLETVIPKEEGARVMVVLGEHRGQVGKILHRDRQKSRALVQLQGDHDGAVTLSYDVICHYTGDFEDYED